MKIDISGRHRYEVSDMLKDYVHEKISRLDKYTLKLEALHVIFKSEKVNQTCELVLLGKNLRLTATAATKAMQASFDAAVSNLENQLARYHEKIKHHPHQKIDVNPEVTPESEDTDEDEVES